MVISLLVPSLIPLFICRQRFPDPGHDQEMDGGAINIGISIHSGIYGGIGSILVCNGESFGSVTQFTYLLGQPVPDLAWTCPMRYFVFAKQVSLISGATLKTCR